MPHPKYLYTDAVTVVLSFLDVHDIFYHCRRVSKTWYNASRSPNSYQNVCMSIADKCSWKNTYTPTETVKIISCIWMKLVNSAKGRELIPFPEKFALIVDDKETVRHGTSWFMGLACPCIGENLCLFLKKYFLSSSRISTSIMLYVIRDSLSHLLKI